MNRLSEKFSPTNIFVKYVFSSEIFIFRVVKKENSGCMTRFPLKTGIAPILKRIIRYSVCKKKITQLCGCMVKIIFTQRKFFDSIQLLNFLSL